jgi:hypothetical protein
MVASEGSERYPQINAMRTFAGHPPRGLRNSHRRKGTGATIGLWPAWGGEKTVAEMEQKEGQVEVNAKDPLLNHDPSEANCFR